MYKRQILHFTPFAWAVSVDVPATCIFCPVAVDREIATFLSMCRPCCFAILCEIIVMEHPVSGVPVISNVLSS